MKTIIELLKENSLVTEYKINIHQKESCELFFVKGKLETVRRTDTCDKEVTVYNRHDGYMGDAQFFVYPSTTTEQLRERIADAVKKAQLINNPDYQLPAGEKASYTVDSNFADQELFQLATAIAEAVFAADGVENTALNSVEVFVEKHIEQVYNSQGLDKTQVRYSAMVETIPTYNGESQSVELYHQYNFGQLDAAAITSEVRQKLQEVKDRYSASTPEQFVPCKVVINPLELTELLYTVAQDLSYSSVYSHANLFKKRDAIQKTPTGDLLNITMAGQVPGSVRSSKIDLDGMTLDRICIVDKGVAVNYFGSNRLGQYLGENPTGNLRCMQVAPGTAKTGDLKNTAYLEIVSMSGLQVDAYNDYIGGEVRLAYYHDGIAVKPVTGISVSGKLSQVMSSIRLWEDCVVYNGYYGPEKAILSDMSIY